MIETDQGGKVGNFNQVGQIYYSHKKGKISGVFSPFIRY